MASPIEFKGLRFFVTFARIVPKIKRKLSLVGSFESLKRSISDRKVEKKRKTAISILAPLMSDLNHRSKIDRIGFDQRVEDNKGSSVHFYSSAHARLPLAVRYFLYLKAG